MEHYVYIGNGLSHVAESIADMEVWLSVNADRLIMAGQVRTLNANSTVPSMLCFAVAPFKPVS